MGEYRSVCGTAESYVCCFGFVREINSITPALSDIDKKALIRIPPTLIGSAQPQPKRFQHRDLFDLDIVHRLHHLGFGHLGTPMPRTRGPVHVQIWQVRGNDSKGSMVRATHSRRVVEI